MAVDTTCKSVIPLGGALVIATLLCYSNTFDAPFVFDDLIRIEQNPSIRALPDAMSDTNRPFGMLTFAVNYAIHGYDVLGYHATNLLIHVMAGLSLFGIARRTLSLPSIAGMLRFSPTLLGLAIALLWLVHPLNTQAVTYIIQRLESLMGLCYLLTLYCFMRSQDSARPLAWKVAAIAVCGFGMGVKEVMVSAPIMVLWYDRAFLSRTWIDLWHRNGKLHVVLFSTWAILAWCMLRITHEYSAGNLVFVEGLTPVSYLLTQAGVISHYLRLSLLPYGQCLDYGWPVATTVSEAFVPLLFIGTLFSFTIWAIFKRPYWGFVGGWFFATLAPTSSFIPISDLAFEQRMYLPLISVATMVVLLGAKVLALAENGKAPTATRPPMPGIVVLFLIALLYGTTTWGRNEVFRTSIGLWLDTVLKAPLNARAHNNLGSALKNDGRIDESIDHFREAIRLRSDFPEAYGNLAGSLLDKKDFIDAAKAGEKAIQLNPKYAPAYDNLGSAFLSLGRIDEAIIQYEAALRLNPNFPEAHFDYGIALVRLGQLDRAANEYQEAIHLKPNYAEAYNNLASIYQARRELPAALENYTRAIHADRNYAEAYHNRGIVHFEMREFDRAWDDVARCRELGLTPNPQFVAALAAASGRTR